MDGDWLSKSQFGYLLLLMRGARFARRMSKEAHRALFISSKEQWSVRCHASVNLRVVLVSSPTPPANSTFTKAKNKIT